MERNIGSNVEQVRINNRKAILNLIKDNGPMPRKDIADATGLSPGTITVLTNEMIAQGILTEIGPADQSVQNKAGRKKILVDINYQHKYVAGVSIEYDYIHIGISDLKGDVLASDKIETDRSISPEECLKNIAVRVKLLFWNLNLSRETMLGIGVTIIGIVDQEKGISLDTFGMWDRPVPVKEILERECETRVVVNNNVRALALAEVDIESAGESCANSIFFIRHGYGIGAAIINDGEIYYGHSNSAAEFGHMVVDKNGPLCFCGKRGCIGAIASQRKIIDDISKLFSKERTPELYAVCGGDPENIMVETIRDSIARNDREIAELIRDRAEMLGKYISMCFEILDTQRVVLYGRFFALELFLKHVIDEMRVGITGFQENMVCVSRLNNTTAYFGGIAIVLRELFYTGRWDLCEQAAEKSGSEMAAD